MVEIADRTKLALRAAQLYYLRDLKMKAIADSLHMSRSSVSRLLSYARDTGLVDIRIKHPTDGISRLQHEIRLHDGVTAYIIPASTGMSVRERSAQVARHAGRILSAMVESSSTIGVAWGNTMAALSHHLVDRPLTDVTVVQLNGAAYGENFGLGYVGDILQRFAEAFNAHVEPLPVPAFFDDPLTKTVLWRERSVARILALQQRIDIAVFGVGDPHSTIPGHVYRNGYLSDADREELEAAEVVGDVATVFLRGDGTHAGIRLNERSSGPDLDTLRRAPRRVCVVSDPSRIPALRGALAAGLVTDLIIDEHSAREVASTYVQSA